MLIVDYFITLNLFNILPAGSPGVYSQGRSEMILRYFFQLMFLFEYFMILIPGVVRSNSIQKQSSTIKKLSSFIRAPRNCSEANLNIREYG